MQNEMHISTIPLVLFFIYSVVPAPLFMAIMSRNMANSTAVPRI